MRGFLLFDIDGVIRDVTGSYRLAIQETVSHFIGWHPTIETIDELKKEGIWNNDWDATIELIRRNQSENFPTNQPPDREHVIEIFNNFYFGGDPDDAPIHWKGLIKNEPLLVNNDFFKQLSLKGFRWGFVSGAEHASAKYVLEQRLGLTEPPLIAMGDAPEKPNPEGLIKLATKLAERPLGLGVPSVAYIGDTVADVMTIKNAKKAIPQQEFVSLAIAPPHLHQMRNKTSRFAYEKALRDAGADKIINCIQELISDPII